MRGILLHRPAGTRSVPGAGLREVGAGGEDVLETYHRPYDPDAPVVCMDETSKQLVGELRLPIPAAANRPERVDWQFTTTDARARLRQLYPRFRA